MALDYQQILMQMNGPRRRQGTSRGRGFSYFLLLVFLAGAGMYAWQAGYFSYGSQRIRESFGALTGSGSPGAEEEAAVADGVFAPDVATGTEQKPLPLPVPASPAAAAAAVKATPPDLAAAKAWTPQSPPASPAPGKKSSAAPAPPPVLTGPRAELKAIDQALLGDPAGAMARLERLAKTPLGEDDAADAAYRIGYAARLLKDEDKAEASWLAAAERWPGTRGGRYSALALADTWFRQYAGTAPQPARWDDVNRLYSTALGADDAPFLADQARAKVKANLATINNGLFFGSAPTKFARYHKVETGELLGSIANRYRVDYESLARLNGIDPNRIRVGMDLKVVVGDVSVVVRKNSADRAKGPTLTWFIDGRWVREYPACLGEGVKTPAGNYVLTSKERNPSWTNPVNGQLLSNDHPENILGTRWMAMKGMDSSGLGIHGTTVPDSIPGYASAGCVRLLNADVEELFSYARIGSKVTVID